MKKIFNVLFCLVLSGNCFAQENISSKESGTYQRKSVAFLNSAIIYGRNINLQWEDDLVSVLQNSVKFDRFDYNNIPQNILDKFFALPSSLPIEERMNRTVVPAILAAVDAQKEIRAMDLLSQQQRNSFITDKAKELGITEDELNAVMNAAYIFAPVYLGHADTSYPVQYGTAYSLTLAAGGYWWKIDNSGEKPVAKLIAHIERTYSSTKYSYEEYVLNGQKISYRYATFRSVLNAIATDVEMATKEIPDFKLSAQILDKNPRNVIISIGKREGINTDDKFWVYELREDISGNITEKRRGWVMVKKVGEKARGLDSTQSQAQIISGMPYIGATVKEIPHLPIDVTAGFTMIPFGVDDKGQRSLNKKYEEIRNANPDTLLTIDDSLKLENDYLGDIRRLKLSNMYGPKLKISYNLLNKAGGSQWWLNAGGEFLVGRADGELHYSRHHVIKDSDSKKEPYEINATALGFGGDISLTKKIFIRRFLLAPELGFGFKSIMLSPQKSDIIDFYISQLSFGLVGNMGVEVALTPILHLGGSAGGHFFTESNVWNSRWRYNNMQDTIKYIDGPDVKSGDWLKTRGLTLSAYVSFTIPHSSPKNNDLVSEKEIAATKPEYADEQTPSYNNNYKPENDSNPVEQEKKQKSGGALFKSLLEAL